MSTKAIFDNGSFQLYIDNGLPSFMFADEYSFDLCDLFEFLIALMSVGVSVAPRSEFGNHAVPPSLDGERVAV